MSRLFSTGRRVYTVSKMDNLQVQAINALSDVEDFLETFLIDELSSEGELKEYISKLEVVKRDFRRVLSQLKVAEGDEFEKNIPALTPLRSFESLRQRSDAKLG